MKVAQLSSLFTVLLTGLYALAFGQHLGIGTMLPHASSVLEVYSTEKGLLIPSLTSAQRDSILNPAYGLLIFDTDKQAMFYHNGVSWNPLLYTTSGKGLPLLNVADPADLAPVEDFGWAVDISGDYAIISNPDDDDGFTDRGSAYIYHRENGVWTEEDKLTGTGGLAYDWFGTTVSISGDYAAVGVPYDDVNVNVNQGSVYVFMRTDSSWNEVAHLTASDGMADDLFGFVSMDGDYLVVGAPNADVNTFMDMGAAYVFVRNDTTWSEQAKITSPTGFTGDHFGSSVAIMGDEIVIGAPEYNFLGGVFVFERNDTVWSLEAILGDSYGSAPRFGAAVALHGDYLLVGTPDEDQGGVVDAGAGYIFYKGSGWISGQTHQAKLVHPAMSDFDYFGAVVSLTSDYALFGVPYDDVNGFWEWGSAHLFRRSGTSWTLDRSFNDDSGQTNGRFGQGIAIDGHNIIIGAPYKNQTGEVWSINIE